ncbi:TCR/Tet family MFS transporter [Fulvivirga sp. M361]|uniref:TCR/Tet family MFS transporter n=1 Tax=Fulvivirga sp. M361 TaxID=2594266 RepID=UPI00117A1388|nr:TCR/Tet family MFS transporter [Fulvivirga sp. M361]TRX61303.1 TCR/Tet family MFS transporter [Fulvivirga sp. M361]
MAKNRKAALGFIFVTLLIDVTGIGIIIPVIPDLIIELTDVSVSEAAAIGGWLIFSFAIMQFIFAPILGGLSDQFGRRPVLLISLFGFAVDYLFVAWAPTLAWLFVGRLIAGIMGASFTTASAYIADISKPEERAKNFGLIGAAFGLGFIIGPSIGGLLGQYGSRVPFFAAAALTLINWLYGYFILPESLEKKNRRKFSWKRANPLGTLMQLKKYPVIISMAGALMLIYIAGHATQSTWAYYTKERFDWNPAWIGYSLTFVGVMVAFVQGVLIRWLMPILGQNRAVYIGLLLYAIGFVLFGVANQEWMLFAFTVVYTLGGIAGPALQGIMSNEVPPTEQGELQGGLTSLISVTSITGPPLMTLIFAYFTGQNLWDLYLPGAPFFVGAVLTLMSLALSLRALSGRRLTAGT